MPPRVVCTPYPSPLAFDRVTMAVSPIIMEWMSSVERRVGASRVTGEAEMRVLQTADLETPTAVLHFDGNVKMGIGRVRRLWLRAGELASSWRW